MTSQWLLLWSITVDSNGLLKDSWGMKEEKQVCWRDLTPSVCVCPLMDHGQQPMKYAHRSHVIVQSWISLRLSNNSIPWHWTYYTAWRHTTWLGEESWIYFEIIQQNRLRFLEKWKVKKCKFQPQKLPRHISKKEETKVMHWITFRASNIVNK